MSVKFSDIFGSYFNVNPVSINASYPFICLWKWHKRSKYLHLFGVIDRLSPFQVPVYLFSREDCYKSQNLLKVVNACKPDLIVLAGFLWLIPKELVRAYPNQIVNIHPALLPNYGGKGMYGMHVHESVKANGETETGITIHYVNDHYDEGAIIFQAKCPVVDSDTAETIAKKVHELEYANYPKVLEQILLEKQTL